nr:hypothetical protein [Tanacetum cinerariifolium]GEY39051.1 hypothetical protein [Tanacetum cinerariifolium]
MLVPQGEGSGTPTESHHIPTSEASQSSQHELPSPSLPPVSIATIPPVIPTSPLPTVIPTDTTPLRHYTRRARIAQSSALPPVANELASPLGDDGQGQAYPTDLGFEADQDRENIAKTSTLPSDSTPRVTSLTADEGSMQQKLDELMALCTSLQSGVVSTASPIIPTAAPIFTTATESTPYTRRKGKEKMVESDTPKKKKLQEQIDVQVARELEEQMAREDQRMSEQILRDAKVARIHAEEELQMKQLQKNYAQVLKYQTLQRKPRSKKQKKDYYMAVIKGHAGWKTKDFKGMSFEQIEAKFNIVWKQIEDFIPMGSKEETKRFKWKGLRIEQESAKKLKTSKEVPKEVKSSEEVTEEKVKEMMQLVPVEEIYLEALQHLDREDLNQLWRLVKESISIRLAVGDKEMELWGRIVGNKMHKSFLLPVIEFPLSEEVPTATEESSHYQKKRDATAEKIALLLKSSSNCQSKSYDSCAKLLCIAITFSKVVDPIHQRNIKWYQSLIQQYLQHEHYALWEVIEFEDSFEAPKDNVTTGSASDGTGKMKGGTVTLTTDDMQKRKNDVKARTTLLLALPDEHQLWFSKHKTAQELWVAIQKTFDGNEATKKTKNNLLKQPYGNFKAESSETLEQTFNRL